MLGDEPAEPGDAVLDPIARSAAQYVATLTPTSGRPCLRSIASVIAVTGRAVPTCTKASTPRCASVSNAACIRSAAILDTLVGPVASRLTISSAA